MLNYNYLNILKIISMLHLFMVFFLLIEIYNDLSNADHSGLNLGLFVYLYYPFCLVFMFLF